MNQKGVPGVNVAGYFRGELGGGETARRMVSALDAHGVQTATVGILARGSRQGHDFETDKVEPTFPINLICVNADALPEFANRAGARLFENRYSIGMWWWEANEFPERFMGSFEYLDEVWVCSQYVADNIAVVSPIPVIKVTMPVSMPEVTEMSREELGLPEGFLFLFSFDYHSVFERKNPLAAVEAFKRAFEPGSGASLVLKSINGDQHPEEHARLVAAAEDHPDIHLIDRYVSFAEKNALAAACDCYVSLHRSEGFGHTLADAMYLGKPVIATAYSGNMDFMTDRNSYLVDYDLVPIGEGSDPYPPTGEWAEPDLEHAASLMRRVFEDQEEAGERGRRAAADIRRTHSPEAAGRVIARRLEHIRSRLDSEPRTEHTSRRYKPNSGDAADVMRKVEENIAVTPRLVPPRTSLGRIASFIRRMALMVIWPFLSQQRTVNYELLGLTKSIDESLREVAYRLEAQDLDILSQLEQHNRELSTRVEELNSHVEELSSRLPKPPTD